MGVKVLGTTPMNALCPGRIARVRVRPKAARIAGVVTYKMSDAANSRNVHSTTRTAVSRAISTPSAETVEMALRSSDHRR